LKAAVEFAKKLGGRRHFPEGRMLHGALDQAVHAGPGGKQLAQHEREHRRGHAVAGHVEQVEGSPVLVERVHVEDIAGDERGGQEAPRRAHPRQRQPLRRQQRVLHGRRRLDVPACRGVCFREPAVVLGEIRFQLQHALAGAQAGPQLILLERLRDEIVGARLDSLDQRLDAAARGEQQHVRVAAERGGAYAARQLDAVHLRHHPVGDDHPERLGLHHLPRLRAIHRRYRLVPPQVEHAGQDQAIDRLAGPARARRPVSGAPWFSAIPG
jgi:hypothetical protein